MFRSSTPHCVATSHTVYNWRWIIPSRYTNSHLVPILKAFLQSAQLSFVGLIAPTGLSKTTKDNLCQWLGARVVGSLDSHCARCRCTTIWTENTQEAFETLKTKIVSPSVLQTFHPDYDTVVNTSAFTVAIGAVLEKDRPSERHPVAFTSRTLNNAERNYVPHELELLAIVDTLREWQSYFHGRTFTVHTDHHPLRYLQTQEHLSPRQVRWLERLVEFNFDVIPIRGKSNKVADALSRQAKDVPSKEEYNKGLLEFALQKTFPTNAISTTIPGPWPYVPSVYSERRVLLSCTFPVLREWFS